MIRYAIYNPLTGQILQWGETSLDVPEGITYIEHQIEGSLANYYVDLAQRVVRPKTQMALVVPVLPPADGVTEAVISGIPASTICEFYVNDELQRFTVTDGTLEMVFVDPAVIRVTFWHPFYQHEPVEIRFI